MLALLQRLKELDNKTFEQFCFHLLKEQYPGIDIQRSPQARRFSRTPLADPPHS
jgi:hypothetical protein